MPAPKQLANVFDLCMPFRFFRLMRYPTANASVDSYARYLTPTAYKDCRSYK